MSGFAGSIEHRACQIWLSYITDWNKKVFILIYSALFLAMKGFSYRLKKAVDVIPYTFICIREPEFGISLNPA
jgi:hypothetical protein